MIIIIEEDVNIEYIEEAEEIANDLHEILNDNGITNNVYFEDENLY